MRLDRIFGLPFIRNLPPPEYPPPTLADLYDILNGKKNALPKEEVGRFCSEIGIEMRSSRKEAVERYLDKILISALRKVILHQPLTEQEKELLSVEQEEIYAQINEESSGGRNIISRETLCSPQLSERCCHDEGEIGAARLLGDTPVRRSPYESQS